MNGMLARRQIGVKAMTQRVIACDISDDSLALRLPTVISGSTFLDQRFLDDDHGA
jgi:hypothetical protein